MLSLVRDSLQSFFQHFEPVEVRNKRLELESKVQTKRIELEDQTKRIELEMKKADLAHSLEMNKIEAELTRCRYNQRARLDDRREAEFLSSGELPRKIREALVRNRRLTPLDQDFESAFFEGARKTLQRVTFPPVGSEEKTVVQPFFDELLPRLCSRQYSPFPNAHAVPTFGSRTPDAAFHLNGRCGSLALVVIGEHKGRSSDGDFSNDEVGHILDMSRDLLENHQVRRHLLFSYLSDGYRFQFFRTDRTENGFVSHKSSLFVGQAGVTRLAWLLQKKPNEDLGHHLYGIPDWQLESTLGRGGQAVAYSAVSTANPQSTENVVVKEFLLQEDRDREVQALQTLATAEVAHVPHLVTSLDANERFYLVSVPVGIDVVPLVDTVTPRTPRTRLRGRHFIQIVDTLQAAHAVGLLHRDVKPDNIFLLVNDDDAADDEDDDDNENVLLSDWASSIVVTDPANASEWQGTLAYHAPRAPGATPSSDLVALVRTACALYRGVFPPYTDDEDEILAFWDRELDSEMWVAMLDAAERCNYDRIRSELIRI